MNTEEIKKAVEEGKRVCWSNEGYVVVKDSLGQWFIKCIYNNNCVGLTHKDGTLAGKEEDFFIVK